MTVAGLREGCILKIDGEKIELIGERTMRIFKFGTAAYEVDKKQDLSFLLK